MVDSYKPHQLTESQEIVREQCGSEVVIIPGGCTSIAQPMDKCINKPFKEHMQGSWEKWMMEERARTPAGNLKQPTRQDVINWVSAAWKSIKEDTIIY